MENVKVFLALYRGKGRWWSGLIRWWTKSIYSHCEFYVKTPTENYLVGISDDQKVRKLPYDMNANKEKWDLIYLDTASNSVYNSIEEVFKETEGCKYDWKGIILSGIFNKKENAPDKYTCSEWVLKVLDKCILNLYPKWYYIYSPQDVYVFVSECFLKRGGDNNE